jgi:hypothetical protein|tara:strand:+ start:1138 stop:1254 length:117 start_codon:yes stop_codon:yes gene_type:complete
MSSKVNLVGMFEAMVVLSLLGITIIPEKWGKVNNKVVK